MATKPISSVSIALTSAVLSAAIVGGSLFYLDPDSDEMRPVQQAVEVTPSALLDAASPACAAEVRQLAANPDCHEDCTTKDGKGKELNGWCCCDGGGCVYMPERVQSCLTEAKEKAVKPVAVEEVGEVVVK